MRHKELVVREPRAKRLGWRQVRRMTSEAQAAQAYIDSIFDDAKVRMEEAIRERNNLKR